MPAGIVLCVVFQQTVASCVSRPFQLVFYAVGGCFSLSTGGEL